MKLLEKLFGSNNYSSKNSDAKPNKAKQNESMQTAFSETEKIISQANAQELISQYLVSEDSQQQKIAKSRLADLMIKKSIDFKDIQNNTNKANLIEVISLIKDEKIQNEFAQKIEIEDTDELLNLTLEAKTAKTRQLLCKRLVSQIREIKQLSPLAKEFKQKDKTAYRIVKEKIDSLKESESEALEQVKLINTLLADTNSLSNRSMDSEYAARLQLLQNRFEQLYEHMPADKLNTVRRNLETANSYWEEYRCEIEASKKREQAIKNAPEHQEALAERVDSLILELAQLDLEPEHMENSDKLASIRKKLSNLKNSWKDSTELKPAEKSIEKLFYNACEAYINLELQLSQQGGLPNQVAKISLLLENRDSNTEDKETLSQKITCLDNAIALIPRHLLDVNMESSQKIPDVVTRGIKLTKEVAEQRQAHVERRKQTEQKLLSLFKSGGAAIRAGRVSQAAGIHHSIQEKIETLGELPAWLSKRNETYEEEYRKFTDWQDYAVIPKKEALIKKMNELPQKGLAPEDLSKKINQLQSDWKKLKQSPGERSDELWDKFQTAADIAWQPCAEHFDDKAKERENNLKNRYRLIEQLDQYYEEYDWDNADWKAVEEILRKSRESFLAFSPVDHNKNSEVTATFDIAKNRIKTKLDTEYEKNKTAKSLLIEQAKKLSDIKELGLATDKAKHLQNQWRNLGRTWRKTENELWKSFREECNKVFTKRHEKYEEEKNERNAEYEKAQEILKRLEALLQIDNEAFLAKRGEKDNLMESFNELGRIPRAKEKVLENEKRKISQKIEAKIDLAQNSQHNKAWQDCFELKAQINKALVNGEFAKHHKNLLSAFEAISVFPEGTKSILNALLSDKHFVYSSKNEQRSSEELRLLCIRAELAADLAVPETDSELKTRYQMSQLRKGLGQQMLSSPIEIRDEIRRLWLSASPIKTEEYDKLFHRFNDSLAKI